MQDIGERTFEFAVRIVKLVRAMPKDAAGGVVARQLARAGTGIGSNVQEAQDAQSKKEFARKMRIARTEARETFYWLRLARQSEMLAPDRLDDITRESDEILRILVKIVKNASSET